MRQEIHLTLDHLTAIALIGNLQLALRHPDNTGPATEIALTFIREIQKALPQYHDIIEMGFNPDHDGKEPEEPEFCQSWDCTNIVAEKGLYCNDCLEKNKTIIYERKSR